MKYDMKTSAVAPPPIMIAIFLLLFADGGINWGSNSLILSWLKHILTPKMSVLKLVNEGMGEVVLMEDVDFLMVLMMWR